METSQFLSFSCDEQVHAVAVGKLVRLRLGLCLLNLGVCEFHDGNFSSRFRAELSVTVKVTVKESGCQRTTRDIIGM